MDIYKLRDNLINTIEGKIEFQSDERIISRERTQFLLVQ